MAFRDSPQLELANQKTEFFYSAITVLKNDYGVVLYKSGTVSPYAKSGPKNNHYACMPVPGAQQTGAEVEKKTTGPLVHHVDRGGAILFST